MTMTDERPKPSKCPIIPRASAITCNHGYWELNARRGYPLRTRSEALRDELQDLGGLPIELRGRASAGGLMQRLGENRTLHGFIEQAAHSLLARQQPLLHKETEGNHGGAERRHRVGAILKGFHAGTIVP